MYRLILKPLALQHAQESYDWYEEKQSGLGELFLADLEACFDRLEANPLSYRKVQSQFRQAILQTFPYVLVFEIINKDIIVYSVFHTSRNPGKKFRKK